MHAISIYDHRALAFSSTDKLLVYGGVSNANGSGAVMLWNTEDGSLFKSREGTRLNIRRVGIDPQSKVVMGFDKYSSSVKSWDVTTGELLPDFAAAGGVKAFASNANDAVGILRDGG